MKNKVNKIIKGVWQPNMKNIIKKYPNIKETFEKNKNLTFFEMCKLINSNGK